MSKRVALAVCLNGLTAAVAPIALAADLSGPAVESAELPVLPHYYVGVFGGRDFTRDQNLFGATPGGAVRDIDVAYEDGSILGVNLGIVGKNYGWGRVRGEVEVAYRQSDIENLALNAVERVVKDGSNTELTTGLINAYYDTPLYMDRVRFSLGAGFGLANVDHNINYLVANAAAIGTEPGNLQIALPSSETTYAWQLIAGAEVKLTPSISLIGDVRHLQTGDVQAERYVGNSIINGVATTQGTLDSILERELSTTTLTGGLRIAF